MNKLFKSKAAKIIVWFLIATIITMFVFVLIVNLIRSEINKTTFDQQFMNFENWIIALVIAAAVNAFMFYSLFKKQFKFIRDSKEQVHGNAKFLIDERKEVSNKAIENFNKEYSNNAVPAFVARIYKDKNKKISFNTILAENKQSTVHTLILGATGAGKTWRFVYPTLYYNMKLGYDKKPNIFVTDVKGEIATKFRDEFKHHDYDVVEINLSDPFKSNRWNPLAKVYDMWNEYLNFENEKCEEAVRLKTEIDAEINNIIEPFFADKKIGENAEWVIGAENIVKGVVWYLLEFCFNELKPEQFNLPAVKSIISSQQNKLMQDLKKIQAKHPLAKCFGFLNDPFVNCASEKQVSGYIGSVSSSLAILENQGIKYLLSDNEIDFVEMLSSDVNEKTKKPKIIFFIIPDEDSTRYAIATLFINQFYNTGVKVSRKFETQALPRTLLFVGDEFFNIPRVKDMQQKIAVARSRNIFFGLIAQNDAQIEKVYKEDAKTIKENCVCHVILSISGSDLSYAKSLSEQIGQKSVISKSFSHSVENKVSKQGVVDAGSYSSSLQALNLIQPNEILALQSPLGILVKNKTLPSVIKFNAGFEFEEIKNIKSNSLGPKYQDYDEDAHTYIVDPEKLTYEDICDDLERSAFEQGIDPNIIYNENSAFLEMYQKLKEGEHNVIQNK